MPLKAVLFDMDGVIVDTEPLHRKAYYKMFSELGLIVEDDLYASFTGASTQSVCEKLIAHFNLDFTWQDLAGIKRNYFKHFFDTDPEFDLIPGVRALIEHYHRNGLTLILASSAHMNTIHWVFEKFGLNSFFKTKVSGADLKESKPHPEIFQLAAQLADAHPNECLVIEDSTNGIKAANAAGIFCAAYASKHSLRQNYDTADLLVYDFDELKIEKIQAYFG
ncbi:HAD family hydrolase [Bergeyella sp. RCAD1439]|uniref:HAD family hydrolase n=1 Tax=Bergeyella anatis TaxID=3113737 RepID=UPI002E170305|nr:HAD family phosphatase [Bergeyella sp. RCAD1439]